MVFPGPYEAATFPSLVPQTHPLSARPACPGRCVSLALTQDHLAGQASEEAPGWVPGGCACGEVAGRRQMGQRGDEGRGLGNPRSG